jgi:hypothetical protein
LWWRRWWSWASGGAGFAAGDAAAAEVSWGTCNTFPPPLFTHTLFLPLFMRDESVMSWSTWPAVRLLCACMWWWWWWGGAEGAAPKLATTDGEKGAQGQGLRSQRVASMMACEDTRGPSPVNQQQLHANGAAPESDRDRAKDKRRSTVVLAVVRALDTSVTPVWQQHCAYAGHALLSVLASPHPTPTPPPTPSPTTTQPD